MFLSTNDGANWKNVNSDHIFYSVVISGTDIFAGVPSGGGVFLSTNNGTSWTQVIANANVASLTVSGTNIYAVTGGRVIRSTNNGATWSQISNGLPLTSSVTALTSMGSSIFAGASDGSGYLLANNGTDWNQVTSGFPKNLFSLCTSGSNLFAGTNEGVYLSTNNGTNWTPVINGLVVPVDGIYYIPRVFSLAVVGNSLFAGTWDGGVYVSTNNGTNWTQLNNGLIDTHVRSLCVNGTNVYAGTNVGMFLSTNNGTNWTELNTGLTNSGVRALVANGANIHAGALGGMYLSTNKGTSWTLELGNADITSFSTLGENIVAGERKKGVYLSTNNGSSWMQINNGLTNTNVYSLAASGSNLFAGTNDGIYLSTNNGTSWTQVNNNLGGTSVSALVANGISIFAATDGGLFTSTNNGGNWKQITNGLPSVWVTALSCVGTNLFAGTPDGIYLSTNSGTSWTQVNNGFTDFGSIITLAMYDTNLFAGTTGGVFLSTNYGANWTKVNSGLVRTWVSALVANGMNIFAGTVGGTGGGGSGVWRRPFSDFGITGVEIVSAPQAPTLASPADSAINLQLTTSLSWNAATGATGYHLQASTSSSFASTVVDDTTLTTTSRSVSALALSTTYYWRVRSKNAAGFSGFSNARSFKTIRTTAVEKLDGSIPTDFVLSQNYPNPFNPTTIIQFALPNGCYVSLRVFDLLGKEVAILLSEELGPGYFSVRWQPDVPSGTYIYRLQAGQLVETKKMTLLR
ncbi:MAG: T9SS type A sorting domain-containing protein [Ignavibacteriales bacterium]|nr:T9SS type A sorting domain-containing protein [Ignavibacteriales bacterium]